MTENHKERWDEMKRDYKNKHMSERQVEEMKKIISKAKTENKKARRTRLWKCCAAAAAAAAVTITVLPNTSSDIAYAMSRIPVLGKWVEAVTFKDYEYNDGRYSADISIPELTVPAPTEQPTGEDSNVQITVKDSDVHVTMKKSAEEINEEIQAITAKLIEEFEEGLQQEEGYQTMQVTSEVVATTDEYFTLKLNCYQAAGSGYEENHYYTIDLRTGERLGLRDLFAEDSDYIGIISAEIKKQMKEQMVADETVSYNLDTDIPEWNFEAITDEASFYLNENEELVVCFNEGEVAPMYMGCVEFVIPNDILESIRQK